MIVNCPSCGGGNPPWARRCARCGASLDESPVEETVRDQAPFTGPPSAPSAAPPAGPAAESPAEPLAEAPRRLPGLADLLARPPALTDPLAQIAPPAQHEPRLPDWITDPPAQAGASPDHPASTSPQATAAADTAPGALAGEPWLDAGEPMSPQPGPGFAASELPREPEEPRLDELQDSARAIDHGPRLGDPDAPSIRRTRPTAAIELPARRSPAWIAPLLVVLVLIVGVAAFLGVWMSGPEGGAPEIDFAELATRARDRLVEWGLLKP